MAMPPERDTSTAVRAQESPASGSCTRSPADTRATSFRLGMDETIPPSQASATHAWNAGLSTKRSARACSARRNGDCSVAGPLTSTQAPGPFHSRVTARTAAAWSLSKQSCINRMARSSNSTANATRCAWVAGTCDSSLSLPLLAAPPSPPTRSARARLSAQLESASRLATAAAKSALLMQCSRSCDAQLLQKILASSVRPIRTAQTKRCEFACSLSGPTCVNSN
mmetsp:Transcript_50028/g.104397  ORF Transcript_50028/g.104397 Transcript_50028/m.104397 type:complete len:225 (+) Transcript_50028:1997-2671(+)